LEASSQPKIHDAKNRTQLFYPLAISPGIGSSTFWGDLPAMAGYQSGSVPFGFLRFLPKADRDQWTTKEMLLEDTFLTEMTCVLAKLGKIW